MQAPGSQPIDSLNLISYHSERAEQLRLKIEEALLRSAILDIEVITRKEIKQLLERDLEALMNIDPLISLLIDLAERDQQEEDSQDPLYVGFYKLDFIKSLNDDYLGVNATNEFIKLLHQKFNEMFSNAQVLKTSYKGAHFTTRVKEAQDVPQLHELSRSTLRPLISTFQKEANRILIDCLERRIEELERNIHNNPASNLTQQQILQDSIATIQRISELLPRLKSQERLGIAFGIDQIQDHSPQALTTTLLNSERAANIVIHRKRTDPSATNDTRSYLAEHDYKYVIADLLRVQEHLEALVSDDHPEAHWRRFFEIDPKYGPIMRKSAIVAYRKEMHRQKDFQERLQSDSEFREAFKFFEHYYATINMIDELKNFMADNFDRLDAYYARIRQIQELVLAIKAALESEDPEKESLLSLHQQATRQLDLSMKDLGNGVTQTFPAYIQSLFKSGRKVVASADHIAFGGDNQQAYNCDALRIIEPYRGIRASTHEEYLQRITEILEDDQEKLDESFLSVGDEGTEILRSRETALAEAYANRGIVIDGTGGDEIQATFVPRSEEGENDEFFTIKRSLDHASQLLKIRIAAVVTDVEFIPAPPDEIVEVNQDNTRRLVDMLLKMEELLAEIKQDPQNSSMLINEFAGDDMALVAMLLGSQIEAS